MEIEVEGVATMGEEEAGEVMAIDIEMENKKGEVRSNEKIIFNFRNGTLQKGGQTLIAQ